MVDHEVSGHVGHRKNRCLAQLRGIQVCLADHESKYYESLAQELMVEYDAILE